MMKLYKAIAIGVFFALPLTITAQNAKERIYTEDRPGTEYMQVHCRALLW
jgi:hypothetical protein